VLKVKHVKASCLNVSKSASFSNDLKILHAISLKFVLELLFAFHNINIRIKKNLLGKKTMYLFIFCIK
jgi:hypothetical protein